MALIEVWEAHRGGGGREMPESCMASFEYAWMIGATPEADVNTTADGILVSLHDSTLARTSNAPAAIAERHVNTLSFEEIRCWEIGGDDYPGQRVPAIEEILAAMMSQPERRLIIDFKNAALDQLAALIRKYDAGTRITFAYCDPEVCLQIKKILPEVSIKNWLGDWDGKLVDRFNHLKKRDFYDFEQIQLHLNDLAVADRQPGAWRYQVSEAFISQALVDCSSTGTLLQVLPWEFDRVDLHRLLDLGVRSFAVDYPDRFCRWTGEWASRQKIPSK